MQGAGETQSPSSGSLEFKEKEAALVGRSLSLTTDKSFLELELKKKKPALIHGKALNSAFTSEFNANTSANSKQQKERAVHSAPLYVCSRLSLLLCVCVCVCVLTIHVQPLHDDGKLHFTGHVTQGAHGHAQLLFGDKSIPITIQDPERLADLCTTDT